MKMGSRHHKHLHLPEEYAFQIVIPHEDHLIAGQISQAQREMLEQALGQLTKRQREEYPGRPGKHPAWYTPYILVKDGKLAIPIGVGLGITYDEAVWKEAEKV